MNKQLLELLEAIENKKAEAKTFLNEGKVNEAKALRDEALELQNKFDIAKDLYEEEKEEIINKVIVTPKDNEENQNFVNAVRTKFQNAMSEGSLVDGGYAVPQDIQTKINELRESKDALQNYITVEPVSTLSGSRNFKTRSQQTGFAEIDENGVITDGTTPKFTNLPYSVKKYAGLFKVTNELLQDSDEAIEKTLVDWIGNDSRVTRNNLILAALGTKAKTAIASVDDVKHAFNVQLDPSFHSSAILLTNQDGFNWLDTKKADDGTYLLQPSVSSPTSKKLGVMDVVMVSNKNLPNDTTTGTKAPIIIGDLKEAVVMFDRQQLSIKASDTAGDAFNTDNTYFRAIEREEVKVRDAEAFVYGQVTIV
ncbi:phage major capsid protein [Lysinibacillus sphaericus]|uniref:phage major capsid protein n=1 Tax=Lysinibacillus sphaericus TaxID=1421 RepID=UPI003CFE609A